MLGYSRTDRILFKDNHSIVHSIAFKWICQLCLSQTELRSDHILFKDNHCLGDFSGIHHVRDQRQSSELSIRLEFRFFF